MTEMDFREDCKGIKTIKLINTEEIKWFQYLSRLSESRFSSMYNPQGKRDIGKSRQRCIKQTSYFSYEQAIKGLNKTIHDENQDPEV